VKLLVASTMAFSTFNQTNKPNSLPEGVSVSRFLASATLPSKDKIDIQGLSMNWSSLSEA